jgi:hypothetical protein
MMTRSWRCSPGSVARSLEDARRAGAAIAGDETAGTIGAPTPLGRVEGRYAFDGELFTVTVTKIPAMLPVEMIWSRLDAVFGPPVITA